MNPQLDLDRLPRHIAVIMDGNGRWARERNRRRVFGHREGSNSVRDIVSCCRRLGIPYLTLYAFSKENAQTARFDKLTLSLAINYGGRQEITRAARLFAADVQQGKSSLEDLSPEYFSRYLFTVSLPDPDLIIRTGGEHRVSNFLLWQLAYTEIYVTRVLWPDFREPQFLEALRDYQKRERRFGRTSEQIEAMGPGSANGELA